MQSVWQVIKGPVITEKALSLKEASQDTGQLLTFRVATEANKREIREAVETIFKVKVSSVRVANYKGKVVRRGRTFGRRNDWKKAYVTIKAGEKPVEYAEVI
ncbi:MAG TPA: 50S ribosomal protein L23 [Blastocatellia bacterium]|nr:50S ribosomal protein L23 [Blastocatellia bacterium]